MKEFNELEEDEFNYWMDAATEYLVTKGFVPFTDEAWASDKYFDQVIAKAQELYEDSDIEDSNI